MRKKLWLVLAAVLAPASLALGQATQPSAWELGPGGQWPPVNVPPTIPAQEPTLDRIEEMLQNKQADAAHKIAVAWLRTHKGSPLFDRGLFLLGQANFYRGNRIMSFYNFDELMDKYPASRYFYPALERQYDIADQYLRGYKNRFFGFAILEATEEATEMLYRIQQRAPGSPLSEKSLLRVADYYFAEGEFDIAADAYAAYIRGYPRSPYLARVRLRQAFSSLAQFRGVKFDATPIIDARQQLLDLAGMYPRIAEEENIDAIVQRIDAALAKKLLTTAEFYTRTHKRDATIFYYRYLIRLYPNSPEAQTARSRLARMGAAPDEPAHPLATQPTTRPQTNPAASTRPEGR